MTVTVETGYCSFCGRPRNLRREEHQLGTLVRSIVTCETCHRTLTSSIGVDGAVPAPAAAEAVKPTPAPAKRATTTAAKAGAASAKAKAKAPSTAKSVAKTAAKAKAPATSKPPARRSTAKKK